MTTIAARYGAWTTTRDTGSSSFALGAYMLGAEVGSFKASHPHDPSDLGRCLRLLELIPEWKERMGEMSVLSPAWAALVAHWDELARLMELEVGIDWSKGKSAPVTYARMREILRQH